MCLEGTFLIQLMWEDPAHYAWWCPWAGGPELYRKAGWVNQEKQVSKQSSSAVSASAPFSRFLPWTCLDDAREPLSQWVCQRSKRGLMCSWESDQSLRSTQLYRTAFLRDSGWNLEGNKESWRKEKENTWSPDGRRERGTQASGSAAGRISVPMQMQIESFNDEIQYTRNTSSESFDQVMLLPLEGQESLGWSMHRLGRKKAWAFLWPPPWEGRRHRAFLLFQMLLLFTVERFRRHGALPRGPVLMGGRTRS